MARLDIAERIKRGDRLLMDGATGSELHRRGIDVNKGTPADRSYLGAWSATANLEAPEAVREVHEDYLRAGADILISNNFWTSRPKMAQAGMEDSWEEATRAGGRLAVQARDNLNPDAYVAAGIAPPSRAGGDIYEEFVAQSRILAGEGADVMLPEYVGRIDDCVAAVAACETVGLPVWLGIRHVNEDGTMQYGESIEDLVAALKGNRVDAILPMCSPPPPISAVLRELNQHWGGPTGVYPSVGYGRATQPGRWDTYEEDRNYSPERLADYGRQWFELGAQIVGGCCATGPEHIAALRGVV